MKVLFVCTANICRSPTAEGVFRKLVADSPLDGQIEIDSVGTHDYHVGEAPDPRAIKHAANRGYDLSASRARQIGPDDIERFDYVLAMDETNIKNLKANKKTTNLNGRSNFSIKSKNFNSNTNKNKASY